MVCGAGRSVSSNQRIEGHRSAMAAHGLETRSEWLVSQWDPTASIQCVLELFKADKGPTALFVWSDDVALPILRGLRSAGIRVPEEVSIVGFDSSIAAESCEPALTSVRQPVREMAEAATHLLISLIRKQEVPQRQILIKPVLDVRASTAQPAGRSS
jgi:LacI family transcriptional regulator